MLTGFERQFILGLTTGIGGTLGLLATSVGEGRARDAGLVVVILSLVMCVIAAWVRHADGGK